MRLFTAYRSGRVLEEGDIIGIDLGVYKDGFYGDAACTFPVGKIHPDAERLLRVTEEALYIGIENARPRTTGCPISHMRFRGMLNQMGFLL